MPDLSPVTFRRLSCDGTVVEMRHGDAGAVLDVGRRARTVPPAMRRALEFRDAGCRFPGCGVRHTDAHHVRHWADGGETSLENLALLCRRHHRAVHEGEVGVQMTDEGVLEFRVPAYGGEPCPGCAARSVDAHTRWQRESLDLEFAIDVLRPPRDAPDSAA